MILVVVVLLFFSIGVDDLVVFGGPSLFSLGPLSYSLSCFNLSTCHPSLGMILIALVWSWCLF
jgi:hypothetical protein